MNEKLSGNWKQLVGEIKKKWGQLTDEDLKKISGDKDKLLGLLEEKYGWAKGKAEEELNQFWDENKESLKGMSEKASETIEAACHDVTKYIKDAPLKSMAIAVGAGVVLSWLMRK